MQQHRKVLNAFLLLLAILVLPVTVGEAAGATDLPMIDLRPGAKPLSVPLDAGSILEQPLFARISPSMEGGPELQVVGRLADGRERVLGGGPEVSIGPDVQELILRLSAPANFQSYDRELQISFYDADKALVGRTRFRLLVSRHWPNWLRWIAALAGASLFGTAFLLAGNTVVNSRFLPPPKKIAAQMTPQVSVPPGFLQDDRRAGRSPLPQLQKALVPRGRFLNWIRANPLAFCLPHGRFCEALDINLMPPFRISLVSVRDLEKQVEREPQRWGGRLLAIANRRGGVSFAAIPDGRGRVGSLRIEHQQNSRAVDGKIVWLTKDHRLLRRSRHSTRPTNAWRLVSH